MGGCRSDFDGRHPVMETRWFVSGPCGQEFDGWDRLCFVGIVSKAGERRPALDRTHGK